MKKESVEVNQEEMSPPSAMDTSSESESEEPLQKRLAFKDRFVVKTLEKSSNKCSRMKEECVDKAHPSIVKCTTHQSHCKST